MSLLGDLVGSVLKIGSQAVGMKMLTIAEANFINGNAYTVADYFIDQAAAAVTDFLFDPTACTGKQVVSEVPIFNASAGPYKIEFYTGTTVSATGTELPSFNRRSTSSNVALAKLYVGPAIVDLGIRFSGLLLPATEVGGGGGGTGSVTFESLPFEVDCAQKILIRVTNLDGLGADFGYKFDWSEVSP
jgi:hypothetical protein